MPRFPNSPTVSASRALTLSLGVAVGLLATGCDPAEAPATASPGQETDAGTTALSPEKQAAFAKEATALKSAVTDPAAYGTAIRELFTRYGIAAPAATDAWHPLIPELVPSASPESGAAGLGKAEAFPTIWKKVKSFDITFPFALVGSAELKPDEVIMAWTEHLDATVDPYLVAFYAPIDNASTGPIQVVGLDDDGNGGYPDAQIIWKNTTGATQHVDVVAFAYNSKSSGRARLKIIYPAIGSPVITRIGQITTSRVFANNPINTDGCHGPLSTRLEEKRISGGLYGTGILGVDVAKMKGANIWDFPTTVDMGFVLKATGGNFVLPYLQNLDGDTFEHGNHYSGWQEDSYSCNIF